jgi:protein-disulfide isomerase
MSDSNNNSKLLVIALILAAVTGLAYYMLSGKQDSSSETVTPPVAEQSAAPAEQTTTEAEQKPVIVETKTLQLPAAAAPKIPSSETSNDPAVEAMMAVRKLGSDDAPIKVVEYSSLTCGHCAAFHKNDFPAIKADYIDTGKVQFIFKEFPLNKPAIDASKLMRCLPAERFTNFMALLFDEQDKWAYQPDYLTPLKQNAKLAGLSDKEVDDCLNNKALETRLVGDMQAASEGYKIQSTPTFIVNDGAKTIVGHQPMAFFRETFDGILGSPTPTTATPAAPAAEEPAPAPEAAKEEVKE